MAKHALNNVDGFVGRSDEFKVDPRVIVIDPEWNLRESYGDDEDLALMENIKNNGVYEALKVKKTNDNTLLLRDGHRRMWCVNTLLESGFEIKSVPVKLLDKDMTDDRATLYALGVNSGRKFTAFEEAKGFDRLVKHGHDVKDIAAAIGKSKVFVYERLKLVNATPQVRDAVEKGEISIRGASQAVASSGGDAGAQNDAISNGQQSRKVVYRFNKKKSDFIIKNGSKEQGAILDNLLNNDALDKLEAAGVDTNTISLSFKTRQ